MMKILLMFLVPLYFSLSANGKPRSDGGDHAGNGGDLCELRIQTIANDIASWISKGGASGLELPRGLDINVYQIRMLEQISESIVSCTSAPIIVGKAEKTCMNFIDSGQSRIVCNEKRFSESDASAQYVLVHHEYAGLAGFETNITDASKYPISQQISGYLEVHEVKKLVVKPGAAGNCNLISSDLDKELISTIRRNDLVCLKKIAPMVNLNKIFDVGNAVPGTNWGNRLSALSYASCLGNVDAIQILIDSGAYIHYEGIYGTSPVSVAAYTGQADAIRALFKNGAFLNYNTCTYGKDFRPCDSPLGTALLTIGMKIETFKAVETLLQLGANVNLLSHDQTPLAYATVDFRYVDLLIKYGAYPDLGDNIGNSAIFACYTGSCVDKLVAVGADVNKKNNRGWTPLDAAFSEDVRIALLKYGAVSGKTP